MRSRFAVAMLVAGAAVGAGIACGSFEGDAQAPPDAGGAIDAPLLDAAIPVTPDAAPIPDADAPPHCAWDAPFKPALKLFALSGFATDGTPRLTDDELTVYFASTRTGSYGIYVAHRATRADPFGDPVLVSIAPGGYKADPSFEGDASGPLFYQLLDPAITWHVYRSGRTADGGFAAGVEVTSLGPGQSLGPFVRGSELWFYNGQNDLFRAKVLIDGGISEAGAVPELASPAAEAFPMLSHDGVTIYFGSTRADGMAKGNADIWRARRGADGKFAQLGDVLEVNGTANDYPGWISVDECRLYFSSDRDGSLDIFMAERSLPP